MMDNKKKNCAETEPATNTEKNTDRGEGSTFFKILTWLSLICAVLGFVLYQFFPSVVKLIKWVNEQNIKPEQSISILDISDMSHSAQLAYSFDLLDQGHYPEARQVTWDIICSSDAKPMFMALFYYNLALADCHLGNYAMALTELQTSVSIAENDRAYFLLGNIYKDCYHDYPSAIQAYTCALEEKDVIEYRLSRADAYERNQQFDEAEQDYQDVLDQDDKNQTAKRGISRIQAN